MKLPKMTSLARSNSEDATRSRTPLHPRSHRYDYSQDRRRICSEDLSTCALALSAVTHRIVQKEEWRVEREGEDCIRDL